MLIVIIGIMFLVVAVLVTGIIIMSNGNQVINLKYSNKLMTLRVGLQALVILLLFASYLVI